MLRSRKVAIGKYYVDNSRRIAREVLRIDDETVMFKTHHLDTGNSCDSLSECMKPDFINWADHEATPSEMASLQDRMAQALLHAPQFPGPKEIDRA